MRTIFISKNKACCRNILLFILLLVISSCAGNNINSHDADPVILPSSDIVKPVNTNTTPGETENSNAVTLHLIIAADTNDSQIGKSVAVDSRKFQSLMEDIVKQSKGEMILKKIVLQGDSLNNNNLLRAIEYPKVNPDDIIVFLYAGHGHRYQSTPTRWPLMDTPGKITDFAIIIESIKNKNPRQFIILADCCNAVVNRPSIRLLYAGRQLNYDAIKQMFLTSKTQIAASGSIPGQFSFGDNEQGGLFTSLFISNLSKALLSIGADWEEVFQKTRQNVVNMSGLSGNEQTPQYQRYK
ncbi:caspase family protein [Desulfobacterales bacterium HSG17]|nr:caspase family protein [Desulfobacterales bacterium HSG17]